MAVPNPEGKDPLLQPGRVTPSEIQTWQCAMQSAPGEPCQPGPVAKQPPPKKPVLAATPKAATPKARQPAHPAKQNQDASAASASGKSEKERKKEKKREKSQEKEKGNKEDGGKARKERAKSPEKGMGGAPQIQSVVPESRRRWSSQVPMKKVEPVASEPSKAPERLGAGDGDGLGKLDPKSKEAAALQVEAECRVQSPESKSLEPPALPQPALIQQPAPLPAPEGPETQQQVAMEVQVGAAQQPADLPAEERACETKSPTSPAADGSGRDQRPQSRRRRRRRRSTSSDSEIAAIPVTFRVLLSLRVKRSRNGWDVTMGSSKVSHMP